jgi:hypothetical protein
MLMAEYWLKPRMATLKKPGANLKPPLPSTQTLNRRAPHSAIDPPKEHFIVIDSCHCPPEAGSQICKAPATTGGMACPTNGQVGKPIDSLTLKALLAVPLTWVKAGPYRFCPAPDCTTVYYRSDGDQCFYETELRERVFQKHPLDDEVFICYCFRYTVRDIRKAAAKGRGGEIVNAINAGIQAGQCACDIRNPQGTCCLGNVRTAINTLNSQATAKVISVKP